jgi:hypothetical protein
LDVQWDWTEPKNKTDANAASIRLHLHYLLGAPAVRLIAR